MLNPEVIFHEEIATVIDLRRRYEMSYGYHAMAPPNERYTCVDLTTYSGGDEPSLGSCIGQGSTPNAALLNLLEQIAEYAI